ncbi:MAG: hypothetical protein DMF66_08105 [Acidobacteria bacterium]|nr:MAG: hypothetical protein DMF66_08105 [Acidobacteriota bacterium]
MDSRGGRLARRGAERISLRRDGRTGGGVWELIRHITAWENVFRLRLEGQPATEPEEGVFPPVEDISEEAWAEALRRLDGGHERLLQTVARLEDSVLPEKVPGKDYSTRFLLHGVVRHHVYHAGQIALLKKSFAP